MTIPVYVRVQLPHLLIDVPCPCSVRPRRHRPRSISCPSTRARAPSCTRSRIESSSGAPFRRPSPGLNSAERQERVGVHACGREGVLVGGLLVCANDDEVEGGADDVDFLEDESPLAMR